MLGHHAGTYPITSGWASPTGVGGHGSATAGFLIAVFMFTGWDGAVYVNEETKRRFSTPAVASIVVGLLVVALAWVYLLATSVQSAFNDVVAITGLLFSLFYILTALATIAYYRRRVMARPSGTGGRGLGGSEALGGRHGRRDQAIPGDGVRGGIERPGDRRGVNSSFCLSGARRGAAEMSVGVVTIELAIERCDERAAGRLMIRLARLRPAGDRWRQPALRAAAPFRPVEPGRN